MDVDNADEGALLTSAYLTMLGNVRRRDDCVPEVVDDVIVVTMVMESIADESVP